MNYTDEEIENSLKSTQTIRGYLGISIGHYVEYVRLNYLSYAFRAVNPKPNQAWEIGGIVDVIEKYRKETRGEGGNVA